MAIDLSLLADNELDELISAARALKEERRGEALKSARNEILRLAAEAGIDLADLAKGSRKVDKSPKKVAAKYRSSSDASLTWTGRGRKPAWVETHLNMGGELSELAI